MNIYANIDTVKNEIDIQSSVGEVIASRLSEENDEEDEIRRRRLNITVHGAKESDSYSEEKDNEKKMRTR